VLPGDIMSGYRLIHREQVMGEDVAVWSLVTTPLIGKRPAADVADEAALSWRIFAGCSDGYIRSFVVKEVSLSEREASLTASALSFGEGPTHILEPVTASSVALGCASVSVLRNYAGEDDNAGNVVVAGMDLSGIVRIWEFDENDLEKLSLARDPVHVPSKIEFQCDQATGTELALAPPRTILPQLGCLVVAVAYLDGTVSILSTGIPIPSKVENAKQTIPEAGTVLQSWGTGSALACRLVFRPGVSQLAASRHDGTVDLIPIDNGNGEPKQRLHRLSQLVSSPARSLAFTTDGHLLIAGNEKHLVVWDVTRPNGVPAIVNHQVDATAGSAWLWQLVPLDARRFISLATDKTSMCPLKSLLLNLIMV
jgi:hypothetical protein